VLVHADYAPFGRHRVDDPKPVLIQQRIKLRPQRREATGLHLDQLAICTNQIDHETTDRYLEPVSRACQQGLDGSVQRTLAHHPDIRHGHSVDISPGSA
jgi:hypothetical protein